MAILLPAEKEAVSQTVGASKTRRNAKLDEPNKAFNWRECG